MSDDDENGTKGGSGDGATSDDDAAERAATGADEADPDGAAKKAAREQAKQRAKDEARAKVQANALAKIEPTGATESDAAAADRRDLPKWNRARVKRKAPVGEEQDVFQTSVREAGRGAVRRAPLLLIAVLLVAGGIGGAIWWRNHDTGASAEVTQMLATAAAYQARGEIEPNLDTVLGERKRPPARLLAKDEAELRATVDSALAGLESKAPDSEAAELATLVRAAQAMRDGRFADGEALFREFAQAHEDHELAFLAQEGILLAREAQSDPDGAIAQADVLAGEDKGAFYRDQALWHKARLLEAAGRKDEALAVYRQYTEEYPLQDPSIARAQVIERLRELDPEMVPAGVETEAPGAGIDLGAMLQ